MQRLEVSGAVRPLFGSLGVKGLKAQLRVFRPLRVRYVRGKSTSADPNRISRWEAVADSWDSSGWGSLDTIPLGDSHVPANMEEGSGTIVT